MGPTTCGEFPGIVHQLPRVRCLVVKYSASPPLDARTEIISRQRSAKWLLEKWGRIIHHGLLLAGEEFSVLVCASLRYWICRDRQITLEPLHHFGLHFRQIFVPGVLIDHAAEMVALAVQSINRRQL